MFKLSLGEEVWDVFCSLSQGLPTSLPKNWIKGMHYYTWPKDYSVYKTKMCIWCLRSRTFFLFFNNLNLSLSAEIGRSLITRSFRNQMMQVCFVSVCFYKTRVVLTDCLLRCFMSCFSSLCHLKLLRSVCQRKQKMGLPVFLWDKLCCVTWAVLEFRPHSGWVAGVFHWAWPVVFSCQSLK